MTRAHERGGADVRRFDRDGRLALAACAALAVTAAALVVACSSGSGASPACATSREPLNGDFDGYHAWPLTWSYDGGTITGSPHTSGPRQVYLSAAPPHGATEFPIGTIIVKDIGPGPPTADTTLAMIKRGCGYNVGQGRATGWEWADLQNNADGTVTILWAASEPPSGTTYAGDPTSCNTCHGAATDNDSVNAQPELSSF